MKSKTSPIYILGTGLTHDGSTCLLKDGKIIVAIEKERLTRIKHDGMNDTAGIEYCLNAAKIKFEDLSLIVQSGNSSLYVENYSKFNTKPYGQRLIETKQHNVPIITISHHLAHAYNAIGLSPFEEMAILVIDGSGQSLNNCMDLGDISIPQDISNENEHLYLEKDSFYIYQDDKLKSLYKDFSCISKYYFDPMPMFPEPLQNSIGNVYEAASKYCFANVDDVGKLMGLAPFGAKGVYSKEIFSFKNGRVFVNSDWQIEFDKPRTSYEDFKNRFTYFADIAFWVQKEIEKAILYLVNERSKLCKTKNLAYTGGVALNAVCNSKIIVNSSFENLYLTPAAGDNGISIGCAFYGWLEVLQQKKVKHDGNACFGKKYSDSEIENAINEFRKIEDSELPDLIDMIFKIMSESIAVNLAESKQKIQFIIDDMGSFVFDLYQANYGFKKDFITNADVIIKSNARNFILAMCNPHLLSTYIKNNNIQFIGNIQNVLKIFDFNQVKIKLKAVIYSHDLKEGNLQFFKTDNIVDETAKLLANGSVIGWFQDGSEFGPRALGNRSILADPRKKEIQNFINSKVKFREDFRPFAPSVLREDVSIYFQDIKDSPYMIMVAQVQPAWKDKIPAVVHHDNSCRIQTVTNEWNPKYYELITAFKKLTGIGVLLNTSFNRRGMPIVETPEEAIAFFFECDLDYLVLGNYIIGKNKNQKLINQEAILMNSNL